MRIDKTLNIVIPVESEHGVLNVHCTPLSEAMFEQFFLPLSTTFAAIYVSSNLSWHTGPRVAALMLKKEAQTHGMWEGPEGVQSFLMPEIRRLANVVKPNGEVIPLEEAVNKQLFSPKQKSEVENALVFFIVASAMHMEKELKPVLEGAAKLWGASITSSNCMVFAASLKTSTVPETTEKKVIQSSIPR